MTYHKTRKLTTRLNVDNFVVDGVNHIKRSCVTQVREEEAVTYSTVNTSVKTEADNDPSNLYSSVRKPK